MLILCETLSLMSYSSDLRKRVLDFVHNGGSKAEASRTYNVSRTSIYNWLAAEVPLSCKKPGPRGPHRPQLRCPEATCR